MFRFGAATAKLRNPAIGFAAHAYCRKRAKLSAGAAAFGHADATCCQAGRDSDPSPDSGDDRNPGVSETVSVRYDRRPYEEALAQCGVLGVLARFEPHIAGTPPLGLDLPGSDIDVLCFAPDAHLFADSVWHNFAGARAFTAKQLVRSPRPVVASFEVAGWRIELYGEAIPVERQRGWRHFAVERRLLSLGGEGLTVAVLALRQQGMKTEPAFAAALRLRGDPYLALLDLDEQDDNTLVSVLQGQGFAGTRAS